jgi:hypothetical protein
MERWFFVEVKNFMRSVVEGALVVQLEERRGFSGVVFLGTQCAWAGFDCEGAYVIPSGQGIRHKRCSSFEEVVTIPAGSWWWRIMLWVVGEGSF